MFRFAAGAAITAGLLWTVIQMYRLHPYEYCYFNILVGGLQGADGRYDVDVWRSAQREALEAIETLPENRRRVIRFYSCGETIDSINHPRTEWIATPDTADYLLQFRNGCAADSFAGLPVVLEVRRLGVLLARVYERR